MKKTLTYREAGVDISEGERFVKKISPMAKKTFRREVLTEIGSFGALFRLDVKKFKDPVLVSGTDGVGTKLKVAFMADRHDTVGIDLVAMCVNDILTTGAEPLFFLDYFATGRLDAKKASSVVKGIAAGCGEAGCSLVGGETAEMPGFYGEGEYDLSGFAVGAVERSRIVDGSRISAGNALIGLASSGLHSNGFSLVRKVFFDKKKMRTDTYVHAFSSSLGEELLKPTRIYVKAFMTLKDHVKIRGMAHITGGGIPGNLPRILPKGLRAVLFPASWPVPPVFPFLQKLGNVSGSEMKKTFNMGIGYVIVVTADVADRAVSFLRGAGYESFIIGKVVKGGKGVTYS
jgi:phosphoribosylformylglycinamidine cyclo-ligase